MKKIILSVLLASGLVFSSGLPTFARERNYNSHVWNATFNSIISSHPTREQFKNILRKIDYCRACLAEAAILAGYNEPDDEYDFEHSWIIAKCYRSWMKKKYNISFSDNRQVVDLLRSFGNDLVVRSDADSCVLRKSVLDSLVYYFADLWRAVAQYAESLGGEFDNIEEIIMPPRYIYGSQYVDEDTNDYSDEDTYDYSDSENIL